MASSVPPYAAGQRASAIWPSAALSSAAGVGGEAGSEVEQSMMIASFCRKVPITANVGFDFGASGDADEDDPRLLCGFLGAAHLIGTVPDQVVNGLAVAVRHDHQGIARFDNVIGHSVVHQAKADESDFQFGYGGLHSLCG